MPRLLSFQNRTFFAILESVSENKGFDFVMEKRLSTRARAILMKYRVEIILFPKSNICADFGKRISKQALRL